MIFYIDNILLGTNDLRLMHDTKQCLFKNLEMKDMGKASYMIKIVILHDRSQRLLDLFEKAYLNKILERFGIEKCSASVIPI